MRHCLYLFSNWIFSMTHNINPIRHDSGGIDKRYSIKLEYCGHEKPHYVARFCDDEFIGSSAFYSSALMLAIGHNARRKGALTVEGIPA
jgi:hypothetical protein